MGASNDPNFSVGCEGNPILIISYHRCSVIVEERVLTELESDN